MENQASSTQRPRVTNAPSNVHRRFSQILLGLNGDPGPRHQQWYWWPYDLVRDYRFSILFALLALDLTIFLSITISDSVYWQKPVSKTFLAIFLTLFGYLILLILLCLGYNSQHRRGSPQRDIEQQSTRLGNLEPPPQRETSPSSARTGNTATHPLEIAHTRGSNVARGASGNSQHRPQSSQDTVRPTPRSNISRDPLFDHLHNSVLHEPNPAQYLQGSSSVPIRASSTTPHPLRSHAVPKTEPGTELANAQPRADESRNPNRPLPSTGIKPSQQMQQNRPSGSQPAPLSTLPARVNQDHQRTSSEQPQLRRANNTDSSPRNEYFKVATQSQHDISAQGLGITPNPNSIYGLISNVVEHTNEFSNDMQHVDQTYEQPGVPIPAPLNIRKQPPASSSPEPIPSAVPPPPRSTTGTPESFYPRRDLPPSLQLGAPISSLHTNPPSDAISLRIHQELPQIYVQEPTPNGRKLIPTGRTALEPSTLPQSSAQTTDAYRPQRDTAPVYASQGSQNAKGGSYTMRTPSHPPIGRPREINDPGLSRQLDAYGGTSHSHIWSPTMTPRPRSKRQNPKAHHRFLKAVGYLRRVVSDRK